jgi:Kef-type K+ transport system membrane component KefB
MPWLLIATYYIFVLMPSDWYTNGAVWKESLLLSRFAAPTSAGILFTMLAAIGLHKSWIYKKIQVLAIFDDLDTILLMIPLQIAMIGMQWQMGVILVVVVVLLWIGWKKMSSYSLRCDWKSLLLYSALVYGATYVIHILTDHFFGEEGSVHIEVLLPAFVLGMVMKHGHTASKADDRAASVISLLFMLLVGMSMPLIHLEEASVQDKSVIASLPMLSWGSIALHVVMVSLLSNIGKLTPMLFYRDRSLKERLALSVGMFTRGEVGAGVIFIALGYHIGGPILLISVLTLVFNLILTGGFVMIVKRLALSCEKN